MNQPLFLQLPACAALACAICSCSTIPTTVSSLAAPAALGDCTLMLTGIKKGSAPPCVYKMGYDAPMAKLKIFEYIPQGSTASISFDGVGDSCAVHFNGTLRLIAHAGKTYTFTPTGEMKGLEGSEPVQFDATPTGITITLNPNE